MTRRRLMLLVRTGLLLLILAAAEPAAAARRIFNIFFNTTNSMFRIDNTDNVFDVNTGNSPAEYDQANIICPVYPLGTREADMERYIIYNVSREEFDNCRITDPSPKVVAKCNLPHRFNYITITFRPFTPTPLSMEFKPGRDYYFISTSSRSDLHRRIGGRCSTNNMKMVFKISSDTKGAMVGAETQPPPPRLQQEYRFPSAANSVELRSTSEEASSSSFRQASVRHAHSPAALASPPVRAAVMLVSLSSWLLLLSRTLLT